MNHGHHRPQVFNTPIFLGRGLVGEGSLECVTYMIGHDGAWCQMNSLRHIGYMGDVEEEGRGLRTCWHAGGRGDTASCTSEVSVVRSGLDASRRQSDGKELDEVIA